MNLMLEKSVSCPYCAETIEVIIEVIDESQQYIEDCQVCCRPIVFNISVEFDGSTSVTLHTENDSF